MRQFNFKEELAEHAILHNQNCCVNFEEPVINKNGKIVNDSCDCSVKIDDCCRNIRVINKYYDKYGFNMLKFIPKKYKGFTKEQREHLIKFIKSNSNN